MKFKYHNSEFHLKFVLCCIFALFFSLASVFADIDWKSENASLVQLFRENKRKEALDYGLEKIKLLKKTYPAMTYPPAAGDFMTSVAMIAYKTGYHDHAKKLIEESIKYREEKYSMKDPRIGEMAKILANIHKTKGNYHEAVYYLKRMADVRKINFGDKSPKYTDALVRLASVYSAMKEEKKAEDTFSEALKINIKALGEEALETAYTYYSLGDFYLSVNKIKEAERNLLRSLSAFEKIGAKGEHGLILVLDSLGYSYRTKNDYIMAESFFRRSYKLRYKIYGDNNLEVANSLNNLASVLIMEDKDGAADLLNKALKIIEDVSGKESKALIPVYENLSSLAKKSDDKEAYEKYQRMIKKIS